MAKNIIKKGYFIMTNIIKNLKAITFQKYHAPNTATKCIK